MEFLKHLNGADIGRLSSAPTKEHQRAAAEMGVELAKRDIERQESHIDQIKDLGKAAKYYQDQVILLIGTINRLSSRKDCPNYVFECALEYDSKYSEYYNIDKLAEGED